jgi:sugar phosphate permease
MNEKSFEVSHNPEATGMRDSGIAPTESDTEAQAPINYGPILRKVDLNFLPMLCALFLMSFLDRATLGNAAIAGLPKELKFSKTGNDLNLALAIFFLSYGLLEIPSNILLKRVNARYYVVTLTVIWGIVTMCHGFVKNLSGLVVARVFLGIFEAGLMPACSYLMTLWYPREKLVFRVTIFFGSTLLAGAFGGLLARGIMNLDGAGVGDGLSGWRWIFIIEGLMTIAVGVIAFFSLPESPDHARFLTPAEKTALVAHIRRNSGNETEAFSWGEVIATFRIPHVWLNSIMLFCLTTAAYSFVFFLPTIIRDFKASSVTKSQLLSVPPYMCALVFLIIAGFASDRLRTRGFIIIPFIGVAIVGYILILTAPTTTLGPRYTATFLMVTGVWPTLALSMGWITNNVLGQTRRAVAIAVNTTAVCVGGVAGSYVYRPKDAPRYREGHAECIGLLVAAILLAGAQRWWLTVENRRMSAAGQEKVLYVL